MSRALNLSGSGNTVDLHTEPVAPRQVWDLFRAAGVITEKQMVDGQVTVYDVSKRNRNLLVMVHDQASYLVKQGLDAERRETVARETAVYQAFSRLPSGDTLRRRVPDLCLEDAEASLLVTGICPPGRSFADHARHRLPNWAMLHLGAALARLHELPPESCPHGTRPWSPWITHLALPDITEFRNLSSGSLELIHAIRRFPSFRKDLEDACRSWKGGTLIHGDLKFDNFIVARKPESRPRLFLADWELTSQGDSAWDVGSVFSDALATWLYSVPIGRRLPPQAVFDGIRNPLARMKPSFRVFWREYGRKRAIRPSLEFLIRTVRLCAVRLVQTAYERMQVRTHLTTNTVCLLQLSANMLERPLAAASDLLGIGGDSA